MKLSVVLPIYNEEENIKAVYNELKQAMQSLGFDFEIIAVNDGSTDKSLFLLKEIAKQDTAFRVVSFRKNYGQTAAISVGIKKSQGEVIVPMDADLQNDPADIPKLLEKLNQGFDIASGWRKNRKDKINRVLVSKTANFIISKVTGVYLHDYGCTLKAYKADILKEIAFFGEMHRFMPAFGFWQGAKIAEVVVNHRERKFGKSKYGFSRLPKVILDLFTVKFLMVYLSKPMHFFGKIGFYSFLASFLAGVYALYLKFFLDISFIETPLPLLVVFLAFVGVQLILMGILAEILIRIYYTTEKKGGYSVKETINL